jgi:nucleotidyltransferase substrate binding protein (TIGR01987 family)
VGKIKTKYDQLAQVLERLKEAVEDLEKCDKDNERQYRSYRDSLIQRFELSIDLFWKYIKLYLHEEMKQEIEFNAPKPVIRAACLAKLISEKDTEEFLEMLDDRNKSSHLYKEEVADSIAKKIGKYYKLITKYSEKLEPNYN